MAATFTPRPVPRRLSQAELAAIRCDVRADGDERAGRLLDHIDELEQAIRWQASRVEPGQVQAVVTSRVPDDPEQIGRRA